MTLAWVAKRKAGRTKRQLPQQFEEIACEKDGWCGADRGTWGKSYSVQRNYPWISRKNWKGW